MRFDWKLVLAIGAVWFIWGSTFAGMHYAVATIPPFAMAAVRFGVAGAILYAACVARGRARVTRTDLKRALVSGATLLLFGNGMTAYTVQYLPTGINALLLSPVPIWMAVIAFLWGGERPAGRAVGGMILGLAGLVLLIGPHASHTIPGWPAAIAILAGISWSFGSIYGRRLGKPVDGMLSTALQMLAGGALLAIEAAFIGEWRVIHPQAISGASLGGLLYLIVFGSVIGYSAYTYTLHAANAGLASTYAYVNPVVSVAVGYVVFGERYTPSQALASGVIILGVALMIWPAPALRKSIAAAAAEPLAAPSEMGRSGLTPTR